MKSNTPLFIENTKPLKAYNTFGFDVNADFLASTSSNEEILAALSWAKANRQTIFPLGGGSNVVLCNDIKALVLHQINEDIRIVEEDKDSTILGISGGTKWHSVVEFCLSHKLYGIENLSIIPGTAGAAPIQNIGAYGVELSNTLHKVEAIDIETMKIHIFDNADCHFSYRESIFKNKLKNKLIICRLYLKLSKTRQFNLSYKTLENHVQHIHPDDLSLEAISEAVIAIRNSKLPSPEQIGNAGSFFKNPYVTHEQLEKIVTEFGKTPSHKANNNLFKVPAGWLLDQAGWKGFKQGHVGVHTDQALVLVNYNHGTGHQIMDLAQLIIDDIKAKYHITLEMEPNCINYQ